MYPLFLLLLSSSLISLLGNGKFDTLALWQRNPGFRSLADNENVGCSGSEGPVQDVLDMNDIEASNVSFTMSDSTDTTHVTTTSDNDDVSGVELDEASDFALFNVEFDSVVRADFGIGISDSASIMGNNEWNTLVTKLELFDFAEFVASLLRCDSVNCKASLDIVQQPKVFTALFDGDDILESAWVVGISSDLAVDLDESLVHDRYDFSAGESVFKTATEEDGERERFSQSMRSGRWARGITASKLVEHPRTRRG